MTDQEQNSALYAQYMECRKSLQTYEARKANPSATPEELLAPIIASEVRAERNKRLADCDWTQLPDAPVDAAAWATYRQQLRDVTAQAGFPWDVTWPSEPGLN